MNCGLRKSGLLYASFDTADLKEANRQVKPGSVQPYADPKHPLRSRS